MVKTTKRLVPQKQSGVKLIMKDKTYVADDIKNSSATKKDRIVQLIDEGNQLTLLATLIEQIAEKIDLDTPEYTEAKVLFGGIKNILGG